MHYGEQIKRLEVLINRRVNGKLRSFGLTMQQQSVLHIIHDSESSGAPASQRDIEEALGLSNPTVAGLCKRLEAKGLIRRERDPADARIWRIRTTEADELMRARLLARIEEVEKSLTTGMTDAEKDELACLLARMIYNLETEDKEQGGMDHDPTEY